MHNDDYDKNENCLGKNQAGIEDVKRVKEGRYTAGYNSLPFAENPPSKIIHRQGHQRTNKRVDNSYGKHARPEYLKAARQKQRVQRRARDQSSGVSHKPPAGEEI